MTLKFNTNNLTREQLYLLIKDHDISKGYHNEHTGLNYYLKLLKDAFHLYTIKGLDSCIHFISWDVHDVVTACYYEHLNNLFCKKRIEENYLIVVNDRLKNWPHSNEEQISLLESMIKENANSKDTMILDETACDYCRSCLSDPYCNLEETIECDAENNWFWNVYSNGIKNLEKLKFEIFKGQKIKLYPTVDTKIVAEAFYQLGDDILEDIFKNVLIVKKIKYLQGFINKLQKAGLASNANKESALNTYSI